MLEIATESSFSRAAAAAAKPESYGDELTDIERGILGTITYRDLFDYPVTAAEIHRYLHNSDCGIGAVRQALAGPGLASYLETDGAYFALAGRNGLFALRRQRQDRAEQLWPVALAHGRMLASLPFVRMVAVTGSLAVDNPGHDADTDFMLVTEPGRVWSVRLIAKALQYLNSRFSKGELCVNHVVSTAALEHEQQGLYVAQEFAQMVPIFGNETYGDLRSSNAWVLNYLPNADGPPPAGRTCQARFPRVRRWLEFMLRSPLGEAIETWECRRKLRKYNETEFLLGRATPFRAEATGHRRVVREAVENAFADRLQGPREFRANLRILFGQAYHLYRDAKLWKAMQPFPPLGSLYAASVARDLGHTVRVHDSMLSVSTGEWRAALQINNPDVVVLYEDNFNYLTKMCLLSMRDAAVSMIRLAKKRSATVIVCSSDSADEPGPYLDAGADFIIVGEGEETLSDLLRLLNHESNSDPRDIAGLAYRGDDGEIVNTGRRAVLRHIDNIPMPAWDLIDLRRYREIWTRRHGRTALNIVTTRGCPYHCNWCAKPIWGQSYNARSPENVIEELVRLRELTEFDHVWFMDDIFGLKPKWVATFAKLREQAELDIRFKCLARPDLLLRKGEIEALARAGCDIVWMGAESGSQKILDAMEKGTTVGNIIDSSNALRANGVRIGLFIQFGYPGETRADIRATIRMIREIMPDELGISVSYPLPGTRFHDRVRASLGETRHWQDSDDLAMLFKGPYSTAFYRALHRYVHADMAMRRAWRTRDALRLIHGIVIRSWYAAGMAVFARLPHQGHSELQTELEPTAAATPTQQPTE